MHHSVQDPSPRSIRHWRTPTDNSEKHVRNFKSVENLALVKTISLGIHQQHWQFRNHLSQRFSQTDTHFH